MRRILLSYDWALGINMNSVKYFYLIVCVFCIWKTQIEYMIYNWITQMNIITLPILYEQQNLNLSIPRLKLSCIITTRSLCKCNMCVLNSWVSDATFINLHWMKQWKAFQFFTTFGSFFISNSYVRLATLERKMELLLFSLVIHLFHQIFSPFWNNISHFNRHLHTSVFESISELIRLVKNVFSCFV